MTTAGGQEPPFPNILTKPINIITLSGFCNIFGRTGVSPFVFTRREGSSRSNPVSRRISGNGLDGEQGTRTGDTVNPRRVGASLP